MRFARFAAFFLFGSPPLLAAAPATLYERLGGEPVIRQVVEESIDRAASDERTKRSFRDSNLARVKEKLREHLCVLAGGPCQYTGDPVREVHQGLRITEAELALLVQLLRDAMDRAVVGQREKNELLAMLAPMKGDVVFGEEPMKVGGDRLTATSGVQMIEGAAGGGLVPWALVAGYGTRDQVGGSAFATRFDTRDFTLDSGGIAVGILDRVEVSAARQRFDAGAVVPGLALRMDTIGVKVRVAGDAVYHQDSPWPQVAIGAMYKKNRTMEVPRAIGATKSSDVEPYVSATKVWLAGPFGRSLVATGTLRATRANQFGLLGFGGDREGSRKLQPEVSAGVLLTDSLVSGAEYRWKPDNLSAFREDDASDVFVAWFPIRNVSVTLAHVRLGSIAGLGSQNGTYLSLQLLLD